MNLIADRSGEWEVNSILDSKVEDSELLCLVNWKGNWEPTWELSRFLRHSKAVVKRFHQENPTKPSPRRRGSRPRTHNWKRLEED
jgi:hypothetical protein